jgi:hypothetical protein
VRKIRFVKEKDIIKKKSTFFHFSNFTCGRGLVGDFASFHSVKFEREK